MTSRVSKSVSLPTVRIRPREPLALGRGEHRVKDDGNPRPRLVDGAVLFYASQDRGWGWAEYCALKCSQLRTQNPRVLGH